MTYVRFFSMQKNHLKLREIKKLEMSAASGLVLHRQYYFVVADDELTLYKYALKTNQFIEAIALFGGELPSDYKARKKSKPDFESLVYLSSFDGLLVLPSGSTLNRTVGVLVQGSQVTEIYLEALFHSLSEKITDLNIEGVAVCNNLFKLFHRGNGKDQKNYVINLNLKTVLEEIESERRLSAKSLESFNAIEIGQLRGHNLGITDVAIENTDRLWFVAAVETGESTYEDGGYLGAVLGCMNAEGQVVFQAELDSPAKPEGLALDLEIRKFYLVTDSDDRTLPALFLEGDLPLIHFD